MQERDLRQLLHLYKRNEIGDEELLRTLKSYPLERLSHTVLDTHRQLRQGFPEVIYAEGKTETQLKEIAETCLKRDQPLLMTRVPAAAAETLMHHFPALRHNPTARTLSTYPAGGGRQYDQVQVAILTAGTSDIPVAEEARETLLACGINPETVYDVGVAGIHRITEHLPRLQNLHGLIVVAGMDGALPGVIGGVADCPVVAVPTSVGYGVSFGGLSALLSMLNCCASGITVVNVDNGFGAAMALFRMIRAALRLNSENLTKQGTAQDG